MVGGSLRATVAEKTNRSCPEHESLSYYIAAVCEVPHLATVAELDLFTVVT